MAFNLDEVGDSGTQLLSFLKVGEKFRQFISLFKRKKVILLIARTSETDSFLYQINCAKIENSKPRLI